MSGTTDPLSLAVDTSYLVEVTVLNELEDPAENITLEIQEEAEEHQLFVAAKDGAAFTFEYADVESDYGENKVGEDLPVGLIFKVQTGEASSGGLEVSLRHLPELNEQPQKVAGLADDFEAGEALPGELDFKVHFELTIE